MPWKKTLRCDESFFQTGSLPDCPPVMGIMPQKIFLLRCDESFFQPGLWPNCLRACGKHVQNQGVTKVFSQKGSLPIATPDENIMSRKKPFLTSKKIGSGRGVGTEIQESWVQIPFGSACAPIFTAPARVPVYSCNKNGAFQLFMVAKGVPKRIPWEHSVPNFPLMLALWEALCRRFCKKRPWDEIMLPLWWEHHFRGVGPARYQAAAQNCTTNADSSNTHCLLYAHIAPATCVPVYSCKKQGLYNTNGATAGPEKAASRLQGKASGTSPWRSLGGGRGEIQRTVVLNKSSHRQGLINAAHVCCCALQLWRPLEKLSSHHCGMQELSLAHMHAEGRKA